MEMNVTLPPSCSPKLPLGYRIWEAWRDYHRANPEVYEWFIRLIFHKIDRGFKKHSADAIMHAVRFEVEDVNPESSDKYKICNDYVAFYARMFAEEYPDQAGFFRYRQSVADQFFGPL